MPNLAVALKDEIRRLARKEIRAHTSHTARAVAQYRREIARLKREQLAQNKQIAYLQTQSRKASHAPEETGETNGAIRFSARSVKAQRRRTGLSAADYGKLIGVSPITVYNWEQSKTRPRKGQFAALVALRGLGKREALAKLAQVSSTKKATGATHRRRRRAK
jgi:DNA-binding transcriptional regulator YiaG